MLGGRLGPTPDAEIGRGIEFHHRTDRVFHESVAFRTLTRAALEDLLQLGLRRGSARAVAHVGIELLIDTVLARDATARTAYRAALGAAPESRAAIEWKDHNTADRFEELRGRLLEYALAEDDAAPRALASRLGRVLAGRPRLAVDASGRVAIERWAGDARAQVEFHFASLLHEIRGGLGLDLMTQGDVSAESA
jgi:hypothetical protein